jgi:hypothetical protein
MKIHDAKINDDKSVLLWGDGMPCRELLYIDDAVDACLFLMENYDDTEISKEFTKEFLDLYQQSGLVGGGGLDKSLKYVRTIEPKSVQVKNQISQLYNQIQSGKVTSTSDSTNKTGVLDNINLSFDVKKTDEDKPTPPTPPNPKPKYTDCSKDPLPHKFGCRSEQIKEIQKCLGLEPKYQTGNFGPITMRALGGNLLTKEVYEKIKSECGSQSNTSNSTTDYGLKGLGKFNRKFDFGSGKYRSTDGSTDTNISTPSSYGDTGTPVEDETPEEFYNRLYNDGLLTGDVAETVYSDGTRYPSTKRIKYKGPDLSAERLQQLDTILGGFSPSYRRIKQKVKGEDMKYVWLQVKTKRKK